MILEKFISFVQNISNISSDELKKFASKAELKTIRKKEFFVREGEICKYLLFIHKGLFRYFILHEGEDFTKDFAVDHQNPFCTAFRSFTKKEPSHIWIEVLEDSLVWIWEEKEVSLFLQNHPHFSKKMIETLYFRKEERELSFLKLSPEERYHQFLIDFPGLNQRVAQYHIASYLGLSAESLSRIRNRMVKSSKTAVEIDT